MPRLNEKIRSNLLQKSAANNFLQKLISEVSTSFGAALEVDYDNIDPTDAARYFYENYYEKIDLNGEVNGNVISIKTKLSTYEAAIINFITDRISNCTSYVLLGHAGSGKSTLLKYLSHYLYFVEPVLKNMVHLLYIPLSDDTESIISLSQERQLHDYLDKLVCNASYKQLYHTIISCPRDVLQWINTESVNDFRGTFPERQISKLIEDGVDAYIQNLDRRAHHLLFLDIMRYYTRFVKKIVILLDNVDRFNVDIHRHCFDYVDKKVNQYFTCVVAMRISTYKTLDSKISEKWDISAPVSYSIETVKTILQRRIKRCEQILLRSNLNLKTDTVTLVRAFVDLLSRDESLDMLASLSNQNLNILFKKLNMMANSEYFSDTVLQEALLREKGIDKHRPGAPLWIVYSMLFGNHFGSYMSGDQTATSGIVNVFCNQDVRMEYGYFSRLHLLARINTPNFQDETYFSVKQIFDEYLLLFGDDIRFTDTFHRTMYRLVQAALVHTRSCRRYEDEKDIINLIMTDSITISDAGRYYLTSLIAKIDYLYFMKDDINWNANDILCLNAATVGKARAQKFVDTLKALCKLATIEQKMLSNIITKNGDMSDPTINLLSTYCNKYSALRIPYSANFVTFTRYSYTNFMTYINSVDPYFSTNHSEMIANCEKVFKVMSEYEEVFIR